MSQHNQTNEAGVSSQSIGGASLPELEAHCGSWIVTSPRGHVRELSERGNAQRALEAGWLVETAAQYLGRINRAIRERA